MKAVRYCVVTRNDGNFGVMDLFNRCPVEHYPTEAEACTASLKLNKAVKVQPANNETWATRKAPGIKPYLRT